MDLLENCELCYLFNLSQFVETIVIEGDLDPAKEYYIKVTDKFNNSFVTEALTPDAQGVITIDTAADFEPTPIPQAWFNKDAGYFNFEASLTLNDWQPETFTFNALPYECIKVQFYYDTSDKNVIV